jgi:predicted nucleotidyltransferase
MRRSRSLDALFPKTRQAVLAVLLLRPDRWWYLADLARHLGVRSSSLQRELAALVEAGILKRRRDGNRVYFQPDADCPFMPELRGLFVKTAGVVDMLREALAPVAGRIKWAFVYGSIARGDERPDSDVDLMVIGDVGLADISPLVSHVQTQLGRQVNPTVYSAAEFATKLRAGYGFHRGVLNEAKLFLVGNARDLAAASARRTRRRRDAE